MARIELRNIQKYFGAVQVLNDVSLVIEDGEFVVMLGQSGCGKTTMLRAIAGLETINSETISIDAREVQDLRASDRDIAFVFQSFSLYPHMTVEENIAFPLRATRTSQSEREKAVKEVAKVLGIERLLSRRPSALSGGDMQRVAIGRALVRRPKALLMDEPIGSLDAKLREQMRAEIKRLHISRNSTSVYVTHDQVEAMSLADRMIVMYKGVMQQAGPPDEVYLHPANVFVAQFVGSPVMNMMDVVVEGAGTDAILRVGGTAGFAVPPATVSYLNGAPVKLGIRPEAIILSHEPRNGFVETETTNVEPLGSHDIVDVRVGSETLRARCASGFVHGEGAKVWIAIDPQRAHFFDAASGLSLRRSV